MKNFNGIGARWPYTNGGTAVTSGSVVVLKDATTAGGVNVAVAVDDIAANGTGILQIGGDFTLTALSTDTGSPGDPMYWDATNSRLTTTSTSNKLAGVLIATKANGDTTACILLNALPYTG